MKNIIFLIFTIFFSCNSKSQEVNNKAFPTNMTNLYGIEFNIKVPCEIRINDLVVSKNYLSGVIGPEIINQYLVKSGEQKVKIKIFQPNFSSGNLFDNNALKTILEGTYVQTKTKTIKFL